MYPEHPWRGEEFGSLEFEWYLARRYVFNVEFEVDLRPFYEFCRTNNHRTHQLTMKIGARLSSRMLPQYAVSLNWRPYPARYPAGYVRPVRPGTDMLEHVAVREKDRAFAERDVRGWVTPRARRLARRHPRFTVWLLKHFFVRHDIKNNYALLISRNPLRGLGSKVVFHGTHYRSQVLTIPYGDVVTCIFGAPHAFANINFYEPFLKTFKAYMEDPGQIPRDLLEKPYKELPPSQSGKTG